jgi:hypothetical protein
MTRASSINFAPLLRLRRPQPIEVRNEHRCDHCSVFHLHLGGDQCRHCLPAALEWTPTAFRKGGPAMTYMLVIFITVVVTPGGDATVTAPLPVGHYPTAVACHAAATAVISQHLRDVSDKDTLGSRALDLHPVCVPTPEPEVRR